jgi:ubiquinone/menaquinone biosynthesis C-methylase UbiE
MGVVSEQMRSYYDQRAGQYDDWWLGTGRFAGRERPAWLDEVERLVQVVAALPPARVLDVACGTGFLTRHLRGTVVGLDQSAAMLALASARAPQARFVQGDAVPLPFPDQGFDRILASHFYGHLLAGERDAFVAEARRGAPELVIVDSAERADHDPEEWQTRILDDGSRHRVYKRFFTPRTLTAELGPIEVLHEGRWFVVAVTHGPAAATAIPG